MLTRRRVVCRLGHGASRHVLSGTTAWLDSTDGIPVGRFLRLCRSRSASRGAGGRSGLAQQPTTGPAGGQGRREAGRGETKRREEGRRKKEEEKPAEEGPVKLFHGPWLDCEHLDIRGYIEAGFTSNPNWPLSGFNGPDGYNDLSNQAVLDQLYLIAERVAKVENDCGVDYGYRADVMFGTDAHFVQTVKGSEWDSTWSGGSPYYGMAMPQLFGTLQYNKLTLQGGHFFAPCGFENVMPTENFFYSHTYAFLYGEPTTLTGGMATYKLKDKLLVNAGIDTGWNEFKAVNGKINAMFGFNWTSARTASSTCLREVHRRQPARRSREHPLPVQHGRHT